MVWPFTRKPKAVAPKQPTDDEIRAAAREADDLARANWVPSPAFIALGERMNADARDPDFAKKRSKAAQQIRAAIEKVARATGYTADANDWTKAGPVYVTRINLQRDRRGFCAYINLGCTDLAGNRPGGPVFAQSDYVRLGKFTTPQAADVAEPCLLYYSAILDDPAVLDRAMVILAQKALPWLDRWHVVGKPQDLPNPATDKDVM